MESTSTNSNSKKKQVNVNGNGGSSFTAELFGLKNPSTTSSSSTALFSSLFGPTSTGLGRNSSHTGTIKHQHGSHYGDPRYETATEYMNQKGKGETEEPCYFSSSIYYGGQEVYAPNTHPSASQHTAKKDDESDDPSSRGNWWQGSLYY